MPFIEEEKIVIITKNILDDQVPKEMIPTRLDSAMNLYTNVAYKGKTGIIVYNTNPDTWNCLYPFYELNHKFTIDNYKFNNENITYRELIEEYKKVYSVDDDLQAWFDKIFGDWVGIYKTMDHFTGRKKQ